MNSIRCALLLLLAFNTARAQDGGSDLSFAASKGASDDIYTVAALPPPAEGFLIGGHFTAYAGQDRWRLARLHANGSLDEAFDPKDGTGSAPVSRVLALADGKVLVAGPFSRFNGRAARLVARLQPDGALDPGFDASDAFGRSGGAVQALNVLADGRLIVAGRFDSPARGGKVKGVVRLRPDGTLDEEFAAGIHVGEEGDAINAVAALPDGKLLIAGQFSPAGNVTRLEANGRIDPSFRLAVREGAADAMVLQPDGRMVVAFTDGARRWIARLDADGALDAGFHAAALPAGEEGRIETLALQADGAILVGGSFHHWQDARRDGIVRLRPDGALDRTFDPAAGLAVLPFDDPDETPDATVRALLPLTGGRLLVVGRFDLYNGAPCKNLARVFNGPH